MNIAVVGAGGYIGRRLVASLAARGHNVRAHVRRSPPPTFPASVEIVQGELDGAAAVAGLLKERDLVFDLAAPPAGDFDAQFQAVVPLTDRIVRGAASAGVARVVLVSSFAVYAWSKIRGPLNMHSPVEDDLYTRDAYCGAKVWQEIVATRAAAELGVDLTIARPGLVHGAERSYLGRVAERLGPVWFVIGPTHRPPLIEVNSCADALADIAVHGPGGGAVVNLIDPQESNNWQLMLAALSEKRVRGVPAPLPWPLAFAASRLVWAATAPILGERRVLPLFFTPRSLQARFTPVRVAEAEHERRRRTTSGRAMTHRSLLAVRT